MDLAGEQLGEGDSFAHLQDHPCVDPVGYRRPMDGHVTEADIMHHMLFSQLRFIAPDNGRGKGAVCHMDMLKGNIADLSPLQVYRVFGAEDLEIHQLFLGVLHRDMAVADAVDMAPVAVVNGKHAA